MFSTLMRLIFALSSASPILITATMVAFCIGTNDSWTYISTLAAAALCIVGGFMFIREARKRGERTRVSDLVATIAPSGQILPVLFGSYLMPLVSLLFSDVGLLQVTLLTLALVIIALWTANIPPVVSLMLLGYRFYEVTLTNGAGGFNLISKRKVIYNPKAIHVVIHLFKNDYWLLEDDDSVR